LLIRAAFWLIPSEKQLQVLSQISPSGTITLETLALELAPLERCWIRVSTWECEPGSTADLGSLAKVIQEQVQSLVNETPFEEWVKAALYETSNGTTRLKLALVDLRRSLSTFFSLEQLIELAEVYFPE
jgi:hypothetical protein